MPQLFEEQSEFITQAKYQLQSLLDDIRALRQELNELLEEDRHHASAEAEQASSDHIKSLKGLLGDIARPEGLIWTMVELETFFTAITEQKECPPGVFETVRSGVAHCGSVANLASHPVKIFWHQYENQILAWQLHVDAVFIGPGR